MAHRQSVRLAVSALHHADALGLAIAAFRPCLNDFAPRFWRDQAALHQPVRGAHLAQHLATPDLPARRQLRDKVQGRRLGPLEARPDKGRVLPRKRPQQAIKDVAQQPRTQRD